jgi:hypothetical protein
VSRIRLHYNSFTFHTAAIKNTLGCGKSQLVRTPRHKPSNSYSTGQSHSKQGCRSSNTFTHLFIYTNCVSRSYQRNMTTCRISALSVCHDRIRNQAALSKSLHVAVKRQACMTKPSAESRIFTSNANQPLMPIYPIFTDNCRVTSVTVMF